MRRAAPLLVAALTLCALAAAPAAARTGATGTGATATPDNGGVRFGDPVERLAPKPKRKRKARPRPKTKAPRKLAAKPKADTRAPRRDETAATTSDGHRFPLRGAFSYGGADSRFGAQRRGHVHQGQDIAAAEGTPVVATWAGVVRHVAYQARGAGWYVVLEGRGESRSYVFMHLQAGSITVEEGDSLRAGRRLGSVGSTGASGGPHLHFEIWDGAWQGGGHPVDPLPYLKRWSSAS